MDIRRIYAQAEADVQGWLGTEFAAPDLRLDPSLPDVSRRDPEAYTVAVDPDAVSHGTDRNLRSLFIAHITGSLTDIITETLAAHETVLPDGYLDTGFSLDTVDMDASLPDGALIGHKPGWSTLSVAPPALKYVDPDAGAVDEPLATLLEQAVVHAHHSLPLHAHPGYLSDEPYTVAAPDRVGAVHALAPIRGAAQRAFRGMYGIPEGRDLPSVTTAERTGGGVDLDAGTVELDARLLDRMHPGRLERELIEWYKAFHDDALIATLQDRSPAMAERYAAYDPAVDVEEAYFEKLEDAAAKHRHADHRVRFDRSKMPRFDPLARSFRDEDTAATGDHELVHELDFANNPVTRQYWANRAAFDGKYHEDFRNAVVEAITTFEQYVSGGRRDSAAAAAVDDPWRVPAFFDGFLAMTDDADPAEVEHDAASITNPYEFGLYTALSIQDGFAHRYGSRATELTRDFLFTVTTTPDGLKGALERSFDLRPDPNYPRDLRVAGEQAAAADDLDATFVPVADDITADVAELGFHHGAGQVPGTRDRALGLYYEGRALMAGYRAHRGMADDLPRELQRLDVETRELRRWYG